MLLSQWNHKVSSVQLFDENLNEIIKMADNKKTTTMIKDLKLMQLGENDLNGVMEYLMKHFIPNEPTARSVNMSSDDGWKITEGFRFLF